MKHKGMAIFFAPKSATFARSKPSKYSARLSLIPDLGARAWPMLDGKTIAQTSAHRQICFPLTGKRIPRSSFVASCFLAVGYIKFNPLSRCTHVRGLHPCARALRVSSTPAQITAYFSGLVFLEINGIALKDTKGKLYEGMMRMATNKTGKKDFAELLRRLRD